MRNQVRPGEKRSQKAVQELEEVSSASGAPVRTCTKFFRGLDISEKKAIKERQKYDKINVLTDVSPSQNLRNELPSVR